jgi:hypothetical protein
MIECLITTLGVADMSVLGYVNDRSWFFIMVLVSAYSFLYHIRQIIGPGLS